jgi:polyferredoxin
MIEEKGQDRPWWRRWGLWLAVVLLLVLAVGLAVLWVQAPALYKGAKQDAQATATATTRAGILAVWAAAIAALGATAALAETPAGKPGVA